MHFIASIFHLVLGRLASSSSISVFQRKDLQEFQSGREIIDAERSRLPLGTR